MAPAVDINYWAVLVAAVSGYVLGALWYSPLLFGKIFAQLMKFGDKEMKEAKKKGMLKSYLASFVATLVSAYVLAHFIDYAQAQTYVEGLQAAFWIWLGFVAPIMLGTVLWECKPFKLYAINVSYHLVSLGIMGVILTLWV